MSSTKDIDLNPARWALDMEEAQNLVTAVDYDTLYLNISKERTKQICRDFASTLAKQLKVEDLSQDEQVNLYNRLVQIMAIK